MSIITRSTLIVLSLCLAGSAVAQDGPPPQDGDHPHPPPREAIEACEGLIDDDACSLDSPHGTVEGACWAPSDELPLACKPEGMEGPPPRR